MGTRIENKIMIDAPLDLVWRMTNDVESWVTLFEEYASVEILGRAQDTVTFRLTTVPDEQGNVWTWVSERRTNRQAGTADARRTETGPFQHMNIHWSYQEVGSGTEMTWCQEFAMKLGAGRTDEAMADYLNGRTRVQM
ncbi:SRPBCC family protein [Amycolatopsis panacis]|uniref:Polyketide cyclase n=1 Tax=Amycolatopsis panacis TaxID=2340917 RepID=A0A419HXE4_9PSEU|nr:SRPBCC family protein [Amycolatopsis panacis]RJQ81697.1 polyketide cyclase [Amycolatopsis panacis]